MILLGLNIGMPVRTCEATVLHQGIESHVYGIQYQSEQDRVKKSYASHFSIELEHQKTFSQPINS